MTLSPTIPESPVLRLSMVEDLGRLAELERTGLLDEPPDEAFDRLTRLATRVLRAPVSLVSLVDRDRQFFKSVVGLAIRETPLTHSFCQYVVATGEPLVINDARTTPLVEQNRAIRDLGVIAYAGIPLVTSRGHVLGSFCVIDSEPRHWTPEEIGTLRDLAALVTTEIEFRLKLLEAEELTGIGLRLEAPLTGLSEHLQSLLRLVNEALSVPSLSPGVRQAGSAKLDRRRGSPDDGGEPDPGWQVTHRDRLEHFAMLADGRLRGIDTVLGELRNAAARPVDEELAFKPTDLTRPVVRAVTAARVVARTTAIQLTLDDQPLHASCDSRSLEHSVTHLLLSALHHSEGHADIRVAMSRRGDLGELSVSTPAIIPPGDLAKILGRFHYATCENLPGRREPRLAFRTVRGGLEAENGPLHARSARGEGTRFTLRLPLIAGAPGGSRLMLDGPDPSRAIA